jgi:CBS domain-containing protein
MVTDVVAIGPDTDVIDAVRILLKHRVSGVPVVDEDGNYLGVFSEKCSMHVLLDAAYEQLPVHDVRSFMDVEAQTISPDTQLLSIAQVVLLTPYRRLPVVEKGKLIGIVTGRDVMKCWMRLIDEAPSESREVTLMYFSAMFQREEAPLA